MLKVLYLPIGSQPGTEDAFKNVGVNLSVYDFQKDRGNSFLQKVKSYKPDLIHMQLQMTNAISPDVVAKAREIVPNVVMTNWTGDIRKRPSSYFVSISKVVGFSLLSHVGQIELYKKSGCRNPRYWQIGYDTKRYFPKNQKSFEYKVSFAANTYGKNLFPDSALRKNIAGVLKNEFGDAFGLFGSGYPPHWNSKVVDITTTNDVYNNSACVLSVSHFNDVSHYFSDRLLMCLASGRPTIAYRFPGYQSYFADKDDILIAQNPGHVNELVKFCINNPEEATRIGQNGFRKVNAEHSFTSRIIELLTMTNLIHKV